MSRESIFLIFGSLAASVWFLFFWMAYVYGKDDGHKNDAKE